MKFSLKNVTVWMKIVRHRLRCLNTWCLVWCCFREVSQLFQRRDAWHWGRARSFGNLYTHLISYLLSLFSTHG